MFTVVRVYTETPATPSKPVARYKVKAKAQAVARQLSKFNAGHVYKVEEAAPAAMTKFLTF